MPEFFEVKIGNSQYELNTDSLVASMAHQYISKSSLENIENYDLLFELTKNELHDYLRYLCENKIYFVDLFGDWQNDFKAFNAKKNEPLCRDLIFSFTDGSKWSIKLIDLIALKFPRENESVVNFDDSFIADDKKILRWVKTLTWEDVKDFAEETQRPQPEPDYEFEWKNSKKSIQNWENEISLLEYLERDGIISLEDYADDRSISDH